MDSLEITLTTASEKQEFKFNRSGLIRKMGRSMKDAYNIRDDGFHVSPENFLKSILYPFLPAFIISQIYTSTQFEVFKLIHENRIEVFFGLMGSISLARMVQNVSPITYLKKNDVEYRVENISRFLAEKISDITFESSIWSPRLC